MGSAPQRSVYARGWRHLAGTALAGLLLIGVIPDALKGLGLSSDAVRWAMLPLIVAFLLIGGGRGYSIVCPNCGKSIFMRGIFAFPWPEKQCGRCGRDITKT